MASPHMAPRSQIPIGYLTSRNRHDGVRCDVCSVTNFTNRRYKCLICEDYDLCGPCHDSDSSSSQHCPSHPMQSVLTETAMSLHFGNDLGASHRSIAIVCPICGAGGLEMKELLPHLESKHITEGQNRPVLCPICVAEDSTNSSVLFDDVFEHVVHAHDLMESSHSSRYQTVPPRIPPLPFETKQSPPNRIRGIVTAELLGSAQQTSSDTTHIRFESPSLHSQNLDLPDLVGSLRSTTTTRTRSTNDRVGGSTTESKAIPSPHDCRGPPEILTFTRPREMHTNDESLNARTKDLSHHSAGLKNVHAEKLVSINAGGWNQAAAIQQNLSETTSTNPTSLIDSILAQEIAKQSQWKAGLSADKRMFFGEILLASMGEKFYLNELNELEPGLSNGTNAENLNINESSEQECL